MRIPVRSSVLMLGVVPVCLALALPVASLAGGGTTAPSPTAQPRPDREKKVWMNEDVARLNPAFDANRPKQTAAASAPAASALFVVPALRPVVAAAPLLDPQQDPRWYAQQLDSLEGELAAVASREQQLSQFRATGTGLPVGLVLSAPCEGITTDNLIAQLDARRQEILQQIDALGDTARRNSLAPGILVQGRGRAQLASQASAADRVAALTGRVRDNSDEVAQIREAVAGMQQQLAAQGITMLPVTPGNGGNMTTDLLDGLSIRASALQSEISGAEDSARGVGVAPGDLR